MLHRPCWNAYANVHSNPTAKPFEQFSTQVDMCAHQNRQPSHPRTHFLKKVMHAVPVPTPLPPHTGLHALGASDILLLLLLLQSSVPGE
jgi:hypothetical protein